MVLIVVLLKFGVLKFMLIVALFVILDCCDFVIIVCWYWYRNSVVIVLFFYVFKFSCGLVSFVGLLL